MPAPLRLVCASLYRDFVIFCRKQGWRPDRDAHYLSAEGHNIHKILGLARGSFEVYEIDSPIPYLEAILLARDCPRFPNAWEAPADERPTSPPLPTDEPGDPT